MPSGSRNRAAGEPGRARSGQAAGAVPQEPATQIQEPVTSTSTVALTSGCRRTVT